MRSLEKWGYVEAAAISFARMSMLFTIPFPLETLTRLALQPKFLRDAVYPLLRSERVFAALQVSHAHALGRYCHSWLRNRSGAARLPKAWCALPSHSRLELSRQQHGLAPVLAAKRTLTHHELNLGAACSGSQRDEHQQQA